MHNKAMQASWDGCIWSSPIISEDYLLFMDALIKRFIKRKMCRRCQLEQVEVTLSSLSHQGVSHIGRHTG